MSVPTLHPYQKFFPNLFLKKKQKLQKILGDDSCVIKHIGSTAIPGVGGKGIIDILLGFKDKKELKASINKLTKNGYYADLKSRENRIFMSSSGNTESVLGDIHLHLVIKNDNSYRHPILFVDYLKAHPQEKQKYVDLKYKIADEVKENRAKYTKLKTVFIKKIIQLAELEN